MCWEQMTRKIKSANKVETGTRGCFFAFCVRVFSPFLWLHNVPCFLENSYELAGLILTVRLVTRAPTVFLLFHGTSVLPQSYMM